jgi:hypothetical protein
MIYDQVPFLYFHIFDMSGGQNNIKVLLWGIQKYNTKYNIEIIMS